RTEFPAIYADFTGVFTTASATALVINDNPNTSAGESCTGGADAGMACTMDSNCASNLCDTVTLSKSGQPFVCSQWTTENSSGILVGPAILTDVIFAAGSPQQIVVGDTANMVLLDD